MQLVIKKACENNEESTKCFDNNMKISSIIFKKWVENKIQKST